MGFIKQLFAPQSERIDLTEDSALLLRLLENTWLWRQRLVEEVSFAAGTHVRAVSSYQIELPPELLAEVVEAPIPQSANVLLPLTTRDKRLLLGVEIQASQPAHLLPRASIASLQAEYLERLADNAAGARSVLDPLAPGILEAICVFTPGFYRAIVEAHATKDQALADYLQDGLGFPISPGDVAAWRDVVEPVQPVLLLRLAEPPSDFSSSENVLLALPRMDPLPRDRDDVTRVVTGYRDSVLAADRFRSDAFLEVLAEYGRRWEVIVETTVPLLEPTTVRVADDRPLELDGAGWPMHRFALRDARSAHLEIRVVDHALELREYRSRDLEGNPVGLGPLEGIRLTRETLSLYTSEEERPFFVDVAIKLGLRSDLRLIWSVLTALVVAAAGAALVIDSGTGLIDRLAVLSVPTTLAATYLLTRDESALAARLQQGRRAGLVWATAGLWIVVLVRLICGNDWWSA